MLTPAIARVRNDGHRAVVVTREVLGETVAAVAAARRAVVERASVAALGIHEIEAVHGAVIVKRGDVRGGHPHEPVIAAVTEVVHDIHTRLHVGDEHGLRPLSAAVVAVVERPHVHRRREARCRVAPGAASVLDLVLVVASPCRVVPEEFADHQGLVALGDDRRVRVALGLRDEVGDVGGDAAGDATDTDLRVEVFLPDFAVVAVAVGVPVAVKRGVVEVCSDVAVRHTVGRGVEAARRNAVAVRRLSVTNQQDILRRPRAVRVDDEVADLILGIVTRVVQGYPLLGEHADLLAALGPPGDIGVQIAFPGVRRHDDVVVRERGIQRTTGLHYTLDARVLRDIARVVYHSGHASQRRGVVADHRLDAAHAGGVRLSDNLNVHTGVVRDRAASRLEFNRGESDVRDAVPAVAPGYWIRVKRHRIHRAGGIIRLRDLPRARMRKRILHLPGLDDVAVSEHDLLARYHVDLRNHLARREQQPNACQGEHGLTWISIVPRVCHCDSMVVALDRNERFRELVMAGHNASDRAAGQQQNSDDSRHPKAYRHPHAFPLVCPRGHASITRPLGTGTQCRPFTPDTISR